MDEVQDSKETSSNASKVIEDDKMSHESKAVSSLNVEVPPNSNDTKQVFLFTSMPPKTFLREVPKNKRPHDDIEEFDTDEEEANDDVKQPKIGDAVSADYSKHLSYEGDLCIYTDPETKKQSIWDADKNAWISRDVEKKDESSKDEDPMKNYEFDGKNYVYTDSATNVTYKFDQEKNEWLVKEKSSDPDAAGGIYGFENDTHTYTDPGDGSVYFWDKEKNAWFPKIDDDFMARYQMSYGFTDSNTEVKTSAASPNPKADAKTEKERKKLEASKKSAEPPAWFEIDEAHNTAIYISGLPLDVTMDELVELVGKCGLVARDDKNKDKIKLYKDSDGNPKGDALCTYIKVESVELALKVLDGSQLRGKTLSVQRAKFQLKGQYDPALKPKRRKKDKERQKKIQEKLFDWRPERLPGEPLKCERVVIIKNLFTPEDFDKEVTLILEYQQDIRSECAKCGDVKKVTIYDRHPEGVAQVTFSNPDEAQACIQLLNGRWFGQRKITAEIWDGKTKYKIHETDAEIEARLDKWDKFLEEQDDKKNESAKT
ncbi:HIV Tat-specific factor 1 homolog [Chelonus insularis]|uniref:HIV Tat-specific factor 1 homolog n=1 Tax=Chelonus insularis TaxID=460826 RepID=UPI0015897F0E|nr:HIV Tat-specific factor 1 homolog [Chelonus insularis]